MRSARRWRRHRLALSLNEGRGGRFDRPVFFGALSLDLLRLISFLPLGARPLAALPDQEVQFVSIQVVEDLVFRDFEDRGCQIEGASAELLFLTVFTMVLVIDPVDGDFLEAGDRGLVGDFVFGLAVDGAAE